MIKLLLIVLTFSLGLAQIAHAEVVAVRRAAVMPTIGYASDAPVMVSDRTMNAPTPLLIHGVATAPVRPSTVLLIGVLRARTVPTAPTPASEVQTAPPATSESNASGVVKAR
jgi:hypothetical protein